MKRPLAFAALTFALLARPCGAAAADDLIARMAALNPSLHTYTATMHAHVTLKTCPFLATDLVGTLYHQEPGSTKVVFTGGVPMMAEQFDKLFAHVPSPAQWRDEFTVDVQSDDGSTTTYKLVPRKKGNVERIEVKVDDKAATVTSMRWIYANGGYAEMSNRYGAVEGATLVTSQTGHVEEPGYTADITSTLDNYKLNPSLPDGTFSQ
jgi:outer membrane lipoprotein-sorting protein